MTLYTLTIQAKYGFGVTGSESTTARPKYRRWRAAQPLQLYVLAAAALAAVISYPFAHYRRDNFLRNRLGMSGHLSRWVEISNPLHVFALQSKDFGEMPTQYTAQRLTKGDGRSDTLAFGNLNAEGAFLRFNFTRSAVNFPPLDALKNQVNFIATGKIRNSFGDVEYAEDRAPDGPPRTCLRFRMAHDLPSVSLNGIACPQMGKAGLTPQHLACLLQRLNLNSAGDDRALRKYFVSAELRQDRYCNGLRYIDAAEPER